MAATGRAPLRAYVAAIGVRTAVAMLSYGGMVRFGITADDATTPDVEVIAEGIKLGRDEMLAAAGAPAQGTSSWGADQLVARVRPMGRFSRAELEQAYEQYGRAAEGFSTSGDWSGFADQFTEDVLYIEHAYGVMHGREEVRRWIVEVMKPFPHMRFPHAWVAFDEDHDAFVVCIRNVLDHPSEPGVSYEFPNWSRLVYAGDGLFSSEEDIYNPRRDAPTAIGQWLSAGGKLMAEVPRMQHG